MGATPGAALREAGQPRKEGGLSPCQVLTISNKMALLLISPQRQVILIVYQSIPGMGLVYNN